MNLSKEQLIEIILDNTDYNEDDKRKKINQKVQLKKMINNNVNNTEKTLFTFLFNIIDKNNISENIINMSKTKQLTNAQIRKLIKEHNDFVKIKIPKGATKKSLLKAIDDKGFSVDHVNNKLVKKDKTKFKIDPAKQPKTTPSKINIKIKPASNTKKIQSKEDKLSEKLSDEINIVKDEIMQYKNKPKFTDKDLNQIGKLKQTLEDIVEEYKDEKIEDKMNKTLIDKMFKLLDKMLGAKQLVTDFKVDKPPDNYQNLKSKGRSSQPPMQRKNRKPATSKPVTSSSAPQKASALPQRKTRGRSAPAKTPVVEKPKFKIDPSKQPKTTPSKINIKIKPASNTKKIVKKVSDEEVYNKKYDDLFQEKVIADVEDIDDLPIEDKLELLDAFVDKYKNNINSQGQDIFEDRTQAQKFFTKTFKEIREISIKADDRNSGFQGVSMSIQKSANRLLNKVTRVSDEDMKTGIIVNTGIQPLKHFIRYISVGAKDIKKQKKVAGKKGIFKDDMGKYKGYSAQDLKEILKRNNLSVAGSRFDMVNRILNADIKLPPKETKDKKKEKGIKIKIAEKPKEPDPPADDTESEEEEEETEEEIKERERISENNMKNIATMKSIVSSLARTFKLRISLDQKEYELTDEQIDKIKSEITSKDPLEILDEYKSILRKLKDMEITFTGKRLLRSYKDLLNIIDNIVSANQKNYKDTFVKKQEVRPVDKEGLPSFDIARFIQESMEQALDNAQQDQEIDSDEEEEELDKEDLQDPRVQELIKRIKFTIKKLEEKIPKFTDKKDMRIIASDINKVVDDWNKENNVIMLDDLDEIVVQKAKDYVRDIARKVIKKKESDKKYLESFGGVVGRATDPNGTEYTWRTQDEYGKISGAVHQTILKILNELKTTEHPDFKVWDKFRSKTLPEQLDKFYRDVDKTHR